MQSTMEPSAVKSYEKGKHFRDVQVWPLSTELDYDGWLGNFSDDSDRVMAEHTGKRQNTYWKTSKCLLEIEVADYL